MYEANIWKIIFLFLMASSSWAQCESEAQARINAEHRLMDFGNNKNPSPDWAKSKRQFAENVNSARPREVADAKQNGLYNRKNTQFKTNVESKIAEYKERIDKDRQNQRNSRYEIDIVAIERGITGALYNICLLGLSLESAANGASSDPAQTSQPESNTSQQTAAQQQAAQQNQARADQQRQGKRKTNDPAAQAHECVAIDQAGSGNFGAFKNTCAYKVNFTTCNYRPRTIQGGFNWSADFDCEKQQYGLHTPDAGRTVAAHNRNTEMVYWFACKAPATPVDAAFVVGKGIEARCHN
ncbi:hypothetical protein ACHEXK_05305 [Limnohabitans sp. DCL3]|uniref:hypothetical protein n=1 Tax=Limnohabitans sp. DCL3 TaxID=3374103 RepID=UPI003A8C48E3